MRATTLDDMTITVGSMVQFPDPLHGGAYPSLTVYDYRHDEDRVRMQINDTGILAAYFPYDTRDPQVPKYVTSIGYNGGYYTRRSSNVELRASSKAARKSAMAILLRALRTFGRFSVTYAIVRLFS